MTEDKDPSAKETSTAKPAAKKKAAAKKAVAKPKATAKKKVVAKPKAAAEPKAAAKKKAVAKPKAAAKPDTDAAAKADDAPKAAPPTVDEVAVPTPAAAPEPERRAKRKRSVKIEPPPAPPPEPVDEAPKPRPKAAAPRHDDEPPKRVRPPRQRRRKPGGDDRDGAVGAAPRRKVFRQDVPGAPGAPAAPPNEPGRPAAPAPTAKQEQEQAKKNNEQDKITLMLHPAPKAAQGFRRKKKGPMTAKEALKAKLKGKKGKATAPKKEAPPPEAKAGKLKPTWLKATADTAEKILAEAATSGEALVRAWQDNNNAAAIVRAASSNSIAGKVRKSARRSLNVLKSRGVDIPELESSAPAAVEADAPVASFVPPDANGMCFLSISQRQPGGRYQVADVVLRSPIGIAHASSGRIAGKQIRKWKSRVTERFGTAPVDVPVDWARHKIAEARKLHQESKQIIPLGFDSCAAMFEPAPDKEPPHPVADLEDGLADDDVSKAAADSDTLHNDPEFAGWMPDKPAIDEMLQKLGENLGEEGSKDKDRVDEALKEEVASATDRFFTPEIRSMVADRMRDSAISVRARTGDAAATVVLAVARAVREAGLVTSPPREIPFLQGFFRKAVSVMLRQGQGRLQVPVTPPAS